MKERGVAKRLSFIEVNSIVKEIDSELSLEAKKEGLRRPCLTNGIVLAAWRILEARVITGDKHFKGLKNSGK